MGLMAVNLWSIPSDRRIRPISTYATWIILYPDRIRTRQQQHTTQQRFVEWCSQDNKDP